MADIAVLSVGIKADDQATPALAAFTAVAIAAESATRTLQTATQRMYEDMAKMTQQATAMAKEMSFVVAATDAMKAGFSTLSDVARKTMDDIYGFVTNLYNKISQTSVGKALADGFEYAEKSVVSLASKVMALMSSLSSAASAGFKFGSSGGGASETEFLTSFETLGEKVAAKLGSSLGSAFDQAGPKITDTITKAFIAIGQSSPAQFVAGLTTPLMATMSQALNAFATTTTSISGSALAGGGNAASGASATIKSFADTVGDATKQIAGSASAAASALLGVAKRFGGGVGAAFNASMYGDESSAGQLAVAGAGAWAVGQSAPYLASGARAVGMDGLGSAIGGAGMLARGAVGVAGAALPAYMGYQAIQGGYQAPLYGAGLALQGAGAMSSGIGGAAARLAGGLAVDVSGGPIIGPILALTQVMSAIADKMNPITAGAATAQGVNDNIDSYKSLFNQTKLSGVDPTNVLMSGSVGSALGTSPDQALQVMQSLQGAIANVTDSGKSARAMLDAIGIDASKSGATAIDLLSQLKSKLNEFKDDQVKGMFMEQLFGVNDMGALANISSSAPLGANISSQSDIISRQVKMADTILQTAQLQAATSKISDNQQKVIGPIEALMNGNLSFAAHELFSADSLFPSRDEFNKAQAKFVGDAQAASDQVMQSLLNDRENFEQARKQMWDDWSKNPTDLIGQIQRNVTDAIAEVSQNLYEFVQKNVSSNIDIRPAIMASIAWMIDAYTAVADFFKTIHDDIVNSDTYKTVATEIKTYSDHILSALNSLEDFITRVLTKLRDFARIADDSNGGAGDITLPGLQNRADGGYGTDHSGIPRKPSTGTAWVDNNLGSYFNYKPSTPTFTPDQKLLDAIKAGNDANDKGGGGNGKSFAEQMQALIDMASAKATEGAFGARKQSDYRRLSHLDDFDQTAFDAGEKKIDDSSYDRITEKMKINNQAAIDLGKAYATGLQPDIDAVNNARKVELLDLQTSPQFHEQNVKAIQDETAALKQQKDGQLEGAIIQKQNTNADNAGAIGLSGDNLTAYKSRVQEINELKKAGHTEEEIANSKTYQDMIQQNVQADLQAKHIQDATQMADQFNNAMAGGLTDIITGTKTWQQSLTGVLDMMAQIVIKYELTQQMNALMGAIGGSSGGSGSSSSGGIFGALTGVAGAGVASLFGGGSSPSVGSPTSLSPPPPPVVGSGTGGVYAFGGAFYHGSTTPFAQGGAFTNSIVSSPTLFPMATGSGLMGEAGPEAVMPLTRTSDGSLGVRAPSGAAGGGGGGVNIVVNDNRTGSSGSTSGQAGSGVQAQDHGIGSDMKRLISVTVTDAVQAGIKSGSFDKTMTSTYGSRRVPAQR